MYKIGIDLGGTKIEAVLIDQYGKKIFTKRIKTKQNYHGTINDIYDLVEEIQKKFDKIESIGIGMPGAVSLETS